MGNFFNSIQFLSSILSPFLIAYLAYLTNKKNALESQLNERKRLTFETFMDALVESFNIENKKNVNYADIIQKNMLDLKKKLILFSSAETIKAYNTWVLTINDSPENNELIIESVEKFILALSKEIGLDNDGLEKYEIIQVLVKDNLSKSIVESKNK